MAENKINQIYEFLIDEINFITDYTKNLPSGEYDKFIVEVNKDINLVINEIK